MQTYYNKTQENQSNKNANTNSKVKNNRYSIYQFKDNRPEAIAQRKLQETADNHIEKQPKQKKANNTGLPNHLKSGIENLSGYSMDDVKVYYNSNKPTQLQAHAYAQGTNIHIASGQERHLPHEAWHVVQQKQGRVRPTRQMKGKININDDAGLEKEADVMGQKALATSMKNPNNLRISNTSILNGAFQLNGFLSLLTTRGATWGARNIGNYVAKSPLRMNYLFKAKELQEDMFVHATQSSIFMNEGIGASPETQAEVAATLRQRLKEITRDKQPKWVDEFVNDRQSGKYGTGGSDPTARDLMNRSIAKGSLTDEDAALNVILSAGRPQADISPEIIKWLEEGKEERIRKVFLSDKDMQKFLDGRT